MFKSIYHLFFGKKFEFYSPYDLEEAIFRLEALLPQENPEAKNVGDINIEVLDSYTYRFKGKRRIDKSNYVWVAGRLYNDRNGVHVKGLTYVDALTRLSVCMLIGGGLFVTLLIIYQELSLIWVLWIAGSILFSVSYAREPQHIYELCYEALGKSKEKNIEGV